MQCEEVIFMRRSLSLLLSLLMIAGCLCIWAPSSAETVMWVKTKTGRNLNVRSSKDQFVDNKIGSLPNGTQVTVLNVSDGWAEIDYQPLPVNVHAYVRANLLTDQAPARYVSTGTVSSLPSSKIYSSSTVADLNSQYSAMMPVDPYEVTIVPDTLTGTVRLSWAPSTNSSAAAFLSAGSSVSVLSASDSWLMALDPVSGRIGFVPVKFTKQP